jgi:hypothetical protein
VGPISLDTVRYERGWRGLSLGGVHADLDGYDSIFSDQLHIYIIF